jgi:predicted nucleic acid-binding protein
MSERVFLDTSVLVRYLAEDDPPRALAAARLIEGDGTVVISGVVLLETMHAMRNNLAHDNPELARGLIRFVTKENVEVVDADKTHLVAAL